MGTNKNKTSFHQYTRRSQPLNHNLSLGTKLLLGMLILAITVGMTTLLILIIDNMGV